MFVKKFSLINAKDVESLKFRKHLYFLKCTKNCPQLFIWWMKVRFPALKNLNSY